MRNKVNPRKMNKKELVLAICEMEHSIVWAKYNILGAIYGIKEKEPYILYANKKLGILNEIDAKKQKNEKQLKAIIPLMRHWHILLKIPGHEGQRLNNRCYLGDALYLLKSKQELLKMYFDLKPIKEQLESDAFKLCDRFFTLELESLNLMKQLRLKFPPRFTVRIQSCK